MCLAYDRAFTLAMCQSSDLAQHILDAVLGKDVVHVDSFSTEKEFRYYIGGRAMRLDFFGLDQKNNKLINIEMQMSNIGEVPVKMRLNQSYIDRSHPRIGSSLKKICGLIVLFFVNADIFGQGKAIYEPPLDYWSKGGHPFNDGVRRIIVNLKYQGKENTELCHLIEDLKQTNLHKMHSNIMKNALQLVLEGGRDMWIKAFKGGPYDAYMLQFAKGEASGIKKGEAKGEAKKAVATVMHLRRVKGLSAEEISDLVGYPLDEVRAILDKAGA